MVFRMEKMFVLIVAPLACWLLVSWAGCSRSGPEAALPPQQAAAFKAITALNAKVAIRNGEVIYVDFYGTPDVESALVHLKTFPHLEKLNFSTYECDGQGSSPLGRPF